MLLRCLFLMIIHKFQGVPSPIAFADPVYRKVGDSVVLNPGQSFDFITSATWKHESDLALEFLAGELTLYRGFNGRSDLNKTTGGFIINNLMLVDSGSYTPEINDKILDQQKLQVLEPVPKPTVSILCYEKSHCNLTCEAQITSEFGPVTYKWESGDKVLSNKKKLWITKENEESSFICKLENPVSSESSEKVAISLRSGLIYRTVGDSIVLNPGQSFDSIISVTWKHQSDLTLEWSGTEIICYRGFKGRCDLDITTGSLIINNVKLEDSGNYTPEINSKVLDQHKLCVLKPVPKPTVSLQCNNDKTLCSLTCEAQITFEFGPVAYKWESGDKVLSNNKKLKLTKENEQNSVSCVLENPVSRNSREVSNPVSGGNFNYAVLAVRLLLLAAIPVGTGLFVVWKRRRLDATVGVDGTVMSYTKSEADLSPVDLPAEELLTPPPVENYENCENEENFMIHAE